MFLAKAENEGKFDVIITDSSDPVGPAESLFQSPFYVAMDKALKAGGKVCTQAESMWLHLDLIDKLVRDSLQIFANAEYATTQIPTYPAGQIGLLLCSKAPAKPARGAAKAPSCKVPARQVKESEKDQYRYYSSELHSASFVLPRFVAKRLEEAKIAALGNKKRQSLTGEEQDDKKQKTDA